MERTESVADAVVVGAGALGTSAAYHLARAGLRRVVLIERHTVASQTSARAAGMIGPLRGYDDLSELGIAALAKVVDFTKETGETLPYCLSGSLRAVYDRRLLPKLEAYYERAQRFRVKAEMVSPDEAHRLVPWYAPGDALGILYMPDDGFLEPAHLPAGYARAARRLGVSLWENTAVTALETQDGAVSAVVTTRGRVHTPIVVDAAGAWSPIVTALAGARLPVTPVQHQLYVTHALHEVAPDHPVVRFSDAAVYVRPCHGGLMVGGYEPDPTAVLPTAIEPDVQIKDLVFDFDVLRRLTEQIAPYIPALRDVLREGRIQLHRGGLPTMTPDGRYVVGPIGAVPGLWAITGCVVGGLSMSPILGECLAAWIVRGASPYDLSLLSPDRFGAAFIESEQFVSDCLAMYGHSYALPEDQAIEMGRTHSQ